MRKPARAESASWQSMQCDSMNALADFGKPAAWPWRAKHTNRMPAALRKNRFTGEKLINEALRIQ